jgi:hypothetical protein
MHAEADAVCNGPVIDRKEHAMGTKTTLGVVATAFMALVACGGGDDPAPASGGANTGGSSSSLTLSAANPATENTTIDLSKAAGSGNDARPADAFSSAAYCEIYAVGAPGANGRVYALQVYFRQSDQAVLHVSVVGSATASAAASYVVFANNGGNAITGVTIDLAAKTVSFASKVLAGSGGAVGTLAGTVGFPANSTRVAGCGA